MATFGQGINPQLGAIDYSPILRGSMAGAQMAAQGSQMIGQGLANLGQEVGKGVEEYYKKKEKTELKNRAITTFQSLGKANPEFIRMLGIKDIEDTGVVGAVVESLGGPANALQLGKTLNDVSTQRQATALGNLYTKAGNINLSPVDKEFNPIEYSPESQRMAQNQFMADTTTRLQQDKLRAEAQALRTPKPENLTVPEMAIRTELAAEKKRLNRDLTAEEEGKIIERVQLRTSPSPANPEETARYTLLTGEMKDIGARADAALKLRPTLKSLYDKLEKGLQTGELEDFKTTISGYAKAVGIPVDEKMLADKQSARASFGTFLMEYIAATKGSISERENTLFMSMGPQFANTPEANKELLALVISRQDLDMQLGNIYRNGLSNNKISLGKINEDMQAYRQEFEKKYEINLKKLEDKYVPQKPSTMEQKVWDAMPMADKAIFKG
jgi:hypothetical protein